MKKTRQFFLIGLAFGAIVLSPLTTEASETEFKILGGMDAYYVTDNASLPANRLSDRLFVASNHCKDVFGINDIIFGASAKNDSWRAIIELDMYRASIFEVGEANVGLKLYKNLWIEGGYFYTSLPGEYNGFTWHNYFTSYSIATQGTPCKEMGVGLAYDFSDNTSAQLRIVNSGYGDVFDNNRSKSVVAKVSFAEIVPDWTLSIGTLVGNDENLNKAESLRTFTSADIRGKFNNKLEGMFTVQCGTKNDAKIDDNGDLSMAIHYGLTAQMRYHFSKKINSSVRLSYADDKDGVLDDYPGFAPIEFGINLEYRPVDFAYLRLEGGFLSLSAKDEDDAKIFARDNDFYNTRMHVAFSMGMSFDIYNSLK